MKRIKFLCLLAIGILTVSGCSCSKINQETYEKAIKNYNTTDAMEFSRIEIISTAGESIYQRKKIEAKFIFDSNRNVSKMEYSLLVSEGNSGGASTEINQSVKYFYNNDTMYTYSKLGSSQLEKYKETGLSYEDKFNVNTCQDNDCMLLIEQNIVPVFALNSVTFFEISEEGKATFKASCPTFENCASSNELIEYTVVIDKDANIKTIAYEIVNGEITYSIKYSFNKFGSNNVNIQFSGELDSYIEK